MKNLLYLALAFILAACHSGEAEPKNQDAQADSTAVQVVNIYSHRHYDIDQELFDEFEAETGIHVNAVNASADELLMRLETEGASSPADLLLTSDAGRLVRAQMKGLLQPIDSEVLNARIAPNLRAENGEWYALTVRARIMAYAPDRVNPDELASYEDLANPKWKGRILARSSSNIYNQSLLASIIANNGEEAAKEWAATVREHMARDPKGNDRDQVKAVAAGEGDIAVVNTYYLGKMLNSKNEVEREAGESVQIIFPNQDGRGTHINISGAGVTRYAPNKENAIKLLEFLTAKAAQQRYATANHEYPVNPEAEPSEMLKSWGTFKQDSLNLAELGRLNQRAVEIFNEVGWN